MSLRPTLRLAARDARRAKARSILVVAMIGLPVLALAYADVMWRTAVPSTQESLAQRLGASAAMLEAMSGAGQTVIQPADPHSGWGSMGEAAPPASPAAPGAPSGPATPSETLAALDLPAGSRLVIEQQTSVGVHTRTGIGSVGWTEVDLGDPALVGRWTLLEGRAAAGADEVVVTAPLLQRTGLELGGTLELTEPARSYTIVGVTELASYRGSESVVAAPGTLIGVEGGIPVDQVWTAAGFLEGPPVTWEQVLALNQRGVLVTSRAVILDPPATTPYDEQFGAYGSSVSDLLVPVLIASVVVGLALLEVVLLAGAAFAVGARRQAHSLALVAASGGDRRDLRRVVLGGGVVLGLLAGVTGVVLGVTAAFATRLAILSWTTLDIAAFDVRPLELLVVVAVGVLTGILAAVVPARQAARMDVVAALRGQRGSPAPSRRTPVVGVVMVLVGVVLSILGSGWAVAAQRSESLSVRRELIALPIVLGAALVVLGLVVCSPTVVSIAARIAPRLSLAGRLALRDADRNRGRSAPAVAAVLAAVSGSVAVMLYVASLDQHDRLSYTPALPPNTAQLPLQYWTDSDSHLSTVDAEAAKAALERTLPVGTTTVVQGIEDCFGADCTQVVLLRPDAQTCPFSYDDPTATQADFDAAEDDPRCQPAPQNRYYALSGGREAVVGGPDLLAAVGLPVTAEMNSTLERGGVLVTDPLMVDGDGMVRVAVFQDAEAKLSSNGMRLPDGIEPVKVVTVPGVVVPAADSFGPIVLSPAVAGQTGASVFDAGLLAGLTETATTDQVDAARAAVVADLPLDEYALTVERGYQSTYGLGLLALALAAGVVTLGATGIATGLALTDARADHATLAAVGAAPGLRRRLAGAQALVIGMLGVLLGVAAGVVPAISLIGSIDSLTVVWPWPQLVGLVVGIPLLAGGAAFLFTRSRVPMQRRVVA